MKAKKSNIGLALRGAAMGVAEVIPGVSGGTIAFITGIYEQLLQSIKAVDLDFFKLLFGFKVKAAFEKIGGSFLIFLFAGMLAGIVVGIFGITYLLEHFPEPLWGFFFGLIIASGVYIASKIDKIGLIHIVLFLVSMVVSFWITTVIPVEGSTALWFVFLSGCIAICALILPGISGSFVLLLLGMYGIIIPNLKSLLTDLNSDSLMIVGVFLVGCVVGLMSFSRILSYTFEHYKNPTFAVLTGLMIGSLNKIWPWRNPKIGYDKDATSYFDIDLSRFADLDMDRIKLVAEENVLPATYYADPYTLLTLMMLVAGLVVVYLLSRVEQ